VASGAIKDPWGHPVFPAPVAIRATGAIVVMMEFGALRATPVKRGTLGRKVTLVKREIPESGDHPGDHPALQVSKAKRGILGRKVTPVKRGIPASAVRKVTPAKRETLVNRERRATPGRKVTEANREFPAFLDPWVPRVYRERWLTISHNSSLKLQVHTIYRLKSGHHWRHP